MLSSRVPSRAQGTTTSSQAANGEGKFRNPRNMVRVPCASTKSLRHARHVVPSGLASQRDWKVL